MSLKLEYFAGEVLSDPDPKNLGRYKVHIPELQLRMGKGTGILCRNKVHTYRANSSDNGVYGSYMPLQAGTKVIVSIANSDYSSASIDRINIYEKDFDRKDTLPFNVSDHCRDDLYILLRTPKHDTIVAVVEDVPLVDVPPDVRTEPPNSLHIYHHNGETKIIIDKDGIHVNTIHNLSASVGGVVDIAIGGDCNISAGGNVNIDAPKINLNSGLSTGLGYNAFPAADKELKLRNSDSNL